MIPKDIHLGSQQEDQQKKENQRQIPLVGVIPLNPYTLIEDLESAISGQKSPDYFQQRHENPGIYSYRNTEEMQTDQPTPIYLKVKKEDNNTKDIRIPLTPLAARANRANWQDDDKGMEYQEASNRELARQRYSDVLNSKRNRRQNGESSNPQTTFEMTAQRNFTTNSISDNLGDIFGPQIGLNLDYNKQVDITLVLNPSATTIRTEVGSYSGQIYQNRQEKTQAITSNTLGGSSTFIKVEGKYWRIDSREAEGNDNPVVEILPNLKPPTQQDFLNLYIERLRPIFEKTKDDNFRPKVFIKDQENPILIVGFAVDDDYSADEYDRVIITQQDSKDVFFFIRRDQIPNIDSLDKNQKSLALYQLVSDMSDILENKRNYGNIRLEATRDR